MPRKFNLVLLGWPQSGKTTFLSLLAEDSTEVAPSEANEALRDNLSALEQGQGLQHTEQRSRREWSFALESEGGPCLDVRTADFSGELTAELHQALNRDGIGGSVANELQRTLHRSDGIMLFIDCHTLNCSGGWETWANEHVMPILRFVKHVISDQRRHPILFLLTRSDLVEDSFSQAARKSVSETISELQLNAVFWFRRNWTFPGRQVVCCRPQGDAHGKTQEVLPEREARRRPKAPAGKRARLRPVRRA